MSQTVKRRYKPWEFTEEERWINKLAKLGSNLVDAGKGWYTFEDGDEEDVYEYKVQMLRHAPETPKGQEYMAYLESIGLECVATVGKTAYMRKRTDDYEAYFDDDKVPRIKYLKRMNLPIILVVLVAFIAGFILLWNGMVGNVEALKLISIPCFFAGLLSSVGYIMIRAEIKRLKNKNRF